MKELETIQVSSKEIVAPVPTKKQFVGSVRKIPGLFMWRCDINTLEITKAVYEDVLAVPAQGIIRAGTLSSRSRLVVDKGCLYEQALNRRNAERKFKITLEKMGFVNPKFK